jgi:hypothetical protein
MFKMKWELEDLSFQVYRPKRLSGNSKEDYPEKKRERDLFKRYKKSSGTQTEKR